jgi:hypothetical protein
MICTVVSLVPYQVTDTKPGINPYEYTIPPSNGIIPALLVIKDANSPLYRGSDMPNFNMIIPGEEIAKSLVNDYIRAQLVYAEDSHPALFWVPGEEKDGNIVITKYNKELEKARSAQNNWFKRLIELADDEWSKNHQHKTITDIQRFACRSLGQTDNKEWYTSPDPVQMIKCPACMSMIESAAVVCKNCKHVVNKEQAKKLGFIAA